MFVFVSRQGLCSPGWPQILINSAALTFHVLGLKALATRASSDTFMFLTSLSGKKKKKAKIPGTVELLLLCVEETVDYKDCRSKVLESDQGKERGETEQDPEKQETLGKGLWAGAYGT